MQMKGFGAGLALVCTVAAVAGAQMPGAPVLQNAWASPGIVGAIDFAGGADGSLFGAAASWTPASGRFEVSGGGGYRNRTGVSGSGVYGLRVAMPLPFGGTSGSFGFAGFAGIGGGAAGVSHTRVSCAAVPSATGCTAVPAPDSVTVDSTGSTTEVPIGVAIGWRHVIGATHGISVYATPSYVFFSGTNRSTGLFRAAVGADFGITSRIGATAGIEFGSSRARGLGGPSGSVYGVGVSYAFGAR
ncbi:MAG TPA: hypothetical protein VHB25_16225 [Gemmatimonadaceae bacterium]|nr:hypothetical protein [Gemmatimonadaceae bacterium]